MLWHIKVRHYQCFYYVISSTSESDTFKSSNTAYPMSRGMFLFYFLILKLVIFKKLVLSSRTVSQWLMLAFLFIIVFIWIGSCNIKMSPEVSIVIWNNEYSIYGTMCLIVNMFHWQNKVKGRATLMTIYSHPHWWAFLHINWSSHKKVNNRANTSPIKTIFTLILG